MGGGGGSTVFYENKQTSKGVVSPGQDELHEISVKLDLNGIPTVCSTLARIGLWRIYFKHADNWVDACPTCRPLRVTADLASPAGAPAPGNPLVACTA